jgi:hypothetical protein
MGSPGASRVAQLAWSLATLLAALVATLVAALLDGSLARRAGDDAS